MKASSPQQAAARSRRRHWTPSLERSRLRIRECPPQSHFLSLSLWPRLPHRSLSALHPSLHKPQHGRTICGLQGVWAPSHWAPSHRCPGLARTWISTGDCDVMRIPLSPLPASPRLQVDRQQAVDPPPSPGRSCNLPPRLLPWLQVDRERTVDLIQLGQVCHWTSRLGSNGSAGNEVRSAWGHMGGGPGSHGSAGNEVRSAWGCMEVHGHTWRCMAVLATRLCSAW